MTTHRTGPRPKDRYIDRLIANSHAYVASQVVPQAVEQALREASSGLAAAVVQARAEGFAEAAEQIARAIEAATPPAHGHMCPEPVSCAWCIGVRKAAYDAKVARSARPGQGIRDGESGHGGDR
jgi:hypothetical protein